jgi:hypothetical protein
MHGEEHAGAGTEVTRIGEQFGECRGGGIEQQVGHQGAVEAPPGEQVVGQGEDHVMVRAGQQAGPLLRQPVVVNLPRAARTESVFATMPDDAFGLVAGAAFQVAAHLRATAARNQRGRAMLVQRQSMLTGNAGEVPANNAGDGGRHAHSMARSRRLRIPRRSRARST